MLNVRQFPIDQPLKIIIGAGQQAYPGWIATQKEQLNLLQRDDWAASFHDRLADALLCEHGPIQTLLSPAATVGGRRNR